MYEYHNLLHKSGYDLEYVYNPNDFNPMAIPIILDENSSPTEKELMEGRPIYKKDQRLYLIIALKVMMRRIRI